MKILAMNLRCGIPGRMNVNKTLFSRLIVQALAGFDSENKLADFLGVAPNSVRNWRLGLTTPQKKVAREVCEKMGVPLESVMGEVDFQAKSALTATATVVGQEDFTRVPYLEGGRVKSFLAFQTTWLSSVGRPDDMVVLRASGRAMLPTIRDGDVVLLDVSQTLPKDLENRGIYAVMRMGRPTLCRILTGDRAWEAFAEACSENDGAVLCGEHFGQSRKFSREEWEEAWERGYQKIALDFDNFQDYETEFVEESEELEIIGRAVWLGRDMRRM